MEVDLAHSAIYVGLDPGKNGGIVGLYEDGSMAFKHRMPQIGNDYDERAIVAILYNPKIVHVALEDVHAIQAAPGGGKIGASSNFSFGEGKGILRGIIAALFLKYTLVQPKAWQKVAWEGVKKQSNTKATSKVAAMRLFPNEDFLATPKSSVPHDGIIDAAHIANYIRLKYQGNIV